MQDHPARSDSFNYSQDNANQQLTNANYYIPVFLKAKLLFAWVMSLISTNQTIRHPQIGDFFWMTVSVSFLIEFNGYSTTHAVAVHFQYDRYMRRLANESLGRNPIK